MATTPHSHHLGPTYDSTVVMEVGGDTGALVLYADATELGVEVDIFRKGDATPLTHTAIRERHLGGAVLYAGVYPGLPAGDYTVAAVGIHPPTDVTIVGGVVAEVHADVDRDEALVESRGPCRIPPRTPTSSGATSGS
jgi:hypothetical protein